MATDRNDPQEPGVDPGSTARDGGERAGLDLLPVPAMLLEASEPNRILHLNRAFTEQFGYTTRDLPTLDAWRTAVYPGAGYAAAAARQWLEATDQDRLRGLPRTVRARDGREVAIQAVTGPAGPGRLVMLLVDAAAQVRAGLALRASEDRFRRLVDSLPDGVIAHDGGRIVFANAAALRIVGVPDMDAVIGRPVIHFVHPEDRALVAARISRVLEGHEDLEPIHERFLHADGRTLDVEVTATETEIDGRSVSLVVFRDIAERLRQQEERRALDLGVQQAQRLESLSLLAGGVAHDFNNLLAGIVGNTELAMMDPAAAPSVRARLESIQRVARRAGELASQMQAYSGRPSRETEPVDLSALVGDLVDLLRASVARTADIRYELGSRIPAVDADPTQLRQVVLNLVTNAVEALPGGRGRVTVRTGVTLLNRADLARCVLAEDLAEGSFATLEVADDGVGMDPATRHQIFEPFFSTKRPGRGLGLAAVLGIVRAHRGAIELRSAPGRGATFRVHLPASARVARTGRPEGPAASATPPAHRGLVLVVDDEEDVLEVASAMLLTAGFEILQAQDGPGAVRLHGEHRDSLACVILDRNLPGMDGLEVLARLREDEPVVPIVLCSGYPPDERVSAVTAGLRVPYVQKPFRYAELVGAIRDALDARGGG